MARIDFAIGTDSLISIVDDPSEPYPDRHHVWLQVTGEGATNGRDEITLHIGSYGIPTNSQVAESAQMLIEALQTVRDAALARTAAES